MGNTWRFSDLSEELILKKLLTSSQEFSAYYKSERIKYQKPITWATNISFLSDGINAAATRDMSTGKQTIVLRKLPPRLEDAAIVAHEIQHLMLDIEGYPCVSDNPGLENIIPSLNSMLQDVLVDKKLKEYGFNLQDKYEKEFKSHFIQLKKVPTPAGKFDKIFWIFNYTSILLDYEWLKKEGVLINNTFITWFEEKHPDITKESHKLHQLINEIGFDTPEKMTSAYNAIIQKYQLNNYVQVHSFRN